MTTPSDKAMQAARQMVLSWCPIAPDDDLEISEDWARHCARALDAFAASERAEVERQTLSADMWMISASGLERERDEARVEVKRLRKALEALKTEQPSSCDCCRVANDIARAALEGGETK